MAGHFTQQIFDKTRDLFWMIPYLISVMILAVAMALSLLLLFIGATAYGISNIGSSAHKK